jgi:O-antigen ligase
MIVAHPIVGVGLASFMTAFPYYSEYVPRVAHNSYLQLTAESGLLAGASYIIVLTIPFVVLWRRKQPLSTEDRDEYFLSLMSDAIIASLAGFAVCAFFLSIETLELFFYLCMISNYLVVFRSGKQKSLEAPSGRQDAVPQLLEDRKGYSC